MLSDCFFARTLRSDRRVDDDDDDDDDEYEEERRRYVRPPAAAFRATPTPDDDVVVNASCGIIAAFSLTRGMGEGELSLSFSTCRAVKNVRHMRERTPAGPGGEEKRKQGAKQRSVLTVKRQCEQS